MIPATKIEDIENKDFYRLTEEELLIYNYWNIYKEANLYYMLMNSSIDNNMPDLAVVYAQKGKITSMKAIMLKQRLAKLISSYNSLEITRTLNVEFKAA